MRKKVFGKRLKRTKDQRKALFKGLISDVIVKERIITTEAKAKAVRGDLEKLVTKAKKGDKISLQKKLNTFEVKKMINQIAPSFKDKNGGYIRIIKKGRRFSDKASMAIIEWSGKIEKSKLEPKKAKKIKIKKTVKRPTKLLKGSKITKKKEDKK